ncbi:hypothetical protein, partial [Streptococcus pseudopneumoniae]|uniref:hypothetical protein n=1 Tax=Streptococcus pseudopneumoniae TaxID=257758 RepID=UPI001486245D
RNIVDPASGFLQGLYCACVPSTLAYLKKIRSMVAGVRSCIKTIEATGDGIEGACREWLAQGVCDVIYEIIRCGVQFFSKGNERTDTSTSGAVSGVGKLFSSVTAAGTSVSQSVEGRYGGSNMYKTLFVEKQFENSVCIFAFTGSFNLDIDALITESADSIAVDSQAYIT